MIQTKTYNMNEYFEKVDDHILYEELEEFFIDDLATEYIVAMFTKRDMLFIINRMLSTFIDEEEYEKCTIVKVWKERVENIYDPHFIQ